MSSPPPKKAGLLSRFSNFLKSDSLSLNATPSSSNAPSPNASPPQQRPGGGPGTSATSSSLASTNNPSSSPQQQQQQQSSGENSSKRVSPAAVSTSSTTTQQSSNLSGAGAASGGGGRGGVGDDSPSPMCGPLESCANSFTSSSANHSMQRRSDDDVVSGDNSNSNSKEDAFKMFSIIGPSFSATGGTNSVDDLTGLQRMANSSMADPPPVIAVDGTDASSSPATQQKIAMTKEERLHKLQEFFQSEGSKCVAENCAVSPARQRDILEKVAASDHDVDLAIATLRSAYGLSTQSVSVVLAGGDTPKADSKETSINNPAHQHDVVGSSALETPKNSNNAAITSPPPPPSSSAATGPSAHRRRSRSATVAKADLMTLLGPLVPERPISRSINTGNVHGNRYIAADVKSHPQMWFFFGGSPVLVDYTNSTASFGRAPDLMMATSEETGSKSTGGNNNHENERAVELSDEALLALVDEEISRADNDVGRPYDEGSDLSSEISGRSFGSVVDLEEIAPH